MRLEDDELLMRLTRAVGWVAAVLCGTGALVAAGAFVASTGDYGWLLTAGGNALLALVGLELTSAGRGGGDR